ncbi:minor capsid protein [Clostridium thermosuccinogenes]|uniref:minor capsid protein n=1 Tax=Clostridium thermosuccinogenes TaxID=84032 RepID=UPI001379F0DC|nr:minor capsid protein [Pseudoclostridium thermosuccinogenes]
MNNLEYWQNRQAKLLHSIYNKQEKSTLVFLREYKTALKDLQSVVDELFRKYSEKGELSMTEIYKYNRYNNLINNIKDIISTLGKKEKSYVQKSLLDSYVEAALKTGDLITKFNDKEIVTVDFSIVPKAQIERSINYPWSGADYSSRIWDNKTKLVKNLKETVTQGIVQGKSNSQMANELKDVMGKGAYDCRRLVRTETMHIVNSATYDTYKRAGMEKVELIVAEDERLCDECSEAAGVYDIDKAPILPIHANCRCTIVPYFE